MFFPGEAECLLTAWALFYLTILLYRHPLNHHILKRTAVTVSGNRLNLLHHIQPLNHLAEDGILSVKMRRPSAHLVIIRHLRGHLNALFLQHRTRLLDIGRRLLLTIYNIELATAAILLRVYIIRLAGSSKGSTPMIKVRQAELGRNSVTDTTLAQQLTLGGSPGVRISALNHKITDTPMKERSVIETTGGQLQKIIAMQGRIVRKSHTDNTARGFDTYHSTFLLLLALSWNHTQKKEERKEKSKTSFIHILSIWDKNTEKFPTIQEKNKKNI